jgi:hypothetical protein
MSFTLIAGERSGEVRATRSGDAIRLDPDDLREGIGLALEPQGLCRGDTCTPVQDRETLVFDDGIDLAALARVLGAPLALDAEERVAVIGESAASRAARLSSLEAPDFTLPDLDGRLHSLSDQRGRKALLIAYASW